MIAAILGAFFIIIGVIFSVLGMVGIWRLPDTYLRLHASGKTSTLGVIFICLGTGFLRPSAVPELIALSIFIIFSAPVGSHAIAAAIHRGTHARNEAAIAKGEEPILKSGVHHNFEELLEEAKKLGSASDTSS